MLGCLLSKVARKLGPQMPLSLFESHWNLGSSELGVPEERATRLDTGSARPKGARVWVAEIDVMPMAARVRTFERCIFVRRTAKYLD